MKLKIVSVLIFTVVCPDQKDKYSAFQLLDYESLININMKNIILITILLIGSPSTAKEVQDSRKFQRKSRCPKKP
jgi:hypothetical protein